MCKLLTSPRNNGVGLLIDRHYAFSRANRRLTNNLSRSVSFCVGRTKLSVFSDRIKLFPAEVRAKILDIIDIYIYTAENLMSVPMKSREICENISRLFRARTGQDISYRFHYSLSFSVGRSAQRPNTGPLCPCRDLRLVPPYSSRARAVSRIANFAAGASARGGEKGRWRVRRHGDC